MIFNCEITNFIKPINNKILIDYVEFKSYIVIFIVPSSDQNDEDIQIIIIKKHESLNQICEFKIQNQSLIITYDSNLGNGDGAFITPNNEIILTYGEHERFAAKYCGGRDFCQYFALCIWFERR